MKFNRKLYCEIQHYPGLFKYLTNVTVSEFRALYYQSQDRNIKQGAVNTDRYPYFYEEHLLYYLLILNHGITAGCVAELAGVSLSDGKRLAKRCALYCRNEVQNEALLANINERLHLRSVFYSVYFDDNNKIPQGSISSIDYLLHIIPDRFLRQFNCLLNPVLRTESIVTIQSLFRMKLAQKEVASKRQHKDEPQLSFPASSAQSGSKS